MITSFVLVGSDEGRKSMLTCQHGKAGVYTNLKFSIHAAGPYKATWYSGIVRNEWNPFVWRTGALQ